MTQKIGKSDTGDYALMREILIRADEPSFTVEYVRTSKSVSDGSIVRYTGYKISILLTDGLAAVIDNRILNPGSGSILFFHPHDLHFGRFLRNGVHEYLNFHLPLSYFEHYVGGKSLLAFFDTQGEQRPRCVRPPLAIRQRLTDGAQETRRILLQGDTESDIRIFSYLLEVLSICRELSGRDGYANETPPIVSLALTYLSEHYRERLSLSDISKATGCSPSYLSRCFRLYTGASVYKHLLDLRISEACRLLRSGLSVSDTCFSVGFEDCSNFIRTFRRALGKTPLQYQKG